MNRRNVIACEMAIATATTDVDRLDRIYQSALLRLPKPAERDSLIRFLAENRTYFKANPADAKKLTHVGFAPVDPAVDEAELAAWTSVCRVVLNLHEMITRY